MPYWRPVSRRGIGGGAFETIALIRALSPRLLIHGHPPLTENFTMEALPVLRSPYATCTTRPCRASDKAKNAGEIIHQKTSSDALRSQPQAVIPFLVMRDQLMTRVYQQRTGYWKPDGEGMEVFAPSEWAAALDLLGGGRRRPSSAALRPYWIAAMMRWRSNSPTWGSSPTRRARP